MQQSGGAWGPPGVLVRCAGTRGSLWIDSGKVFLADKGGTRELPVPDDLVLPPPPVAADPEPTRGGISHFDLAPFTRLCTALRNGIEGREFGLAICKDMHFASFGREYAQRGVSAVLVPAWDFQRDAWMAARMTAMRGVEGGYTVIRDAREGLLSVSDPFGRFLTEIESGSMPGRVLFARVPIGPQIGTLYAKTGNVLGWLCVALAIAMLIRGRVTRDRASLGS